MVEPVRPARPLLHPLTEFRCAVQTIRLTGAAVSRRGTYAKASPECVNEFLGARW